MLTDDIKGIAGDAGAELTEKKGALAMKVVVAERKAFLSKQKLEYIATFRVDDSAKTIVFSEMLKEAGSGLSSGGDDMSPGFGFKTETYKTGGGPREGSIKEQSDLFGKKYQYAFDFNTIRPKVEAAAAAAGYTFAYQILPVK
jgi:hypothetical protein